ncbi:MAG TPA: hypothetical protein VMV59_00220 [Candidatus Dormibacteraeota bacterium]|nr:hypothetical protein [Candidatus Dormibacteraeota bacterium]
MAVLEVEPMDLGPDVKAVGIELVEIEGPDREPMRGPEAAQIWSRLLPAIAGAQKWSFDFFSHLEPLREFCDAHKISYREGSKRSIVLSSLKREELAPLLERFERETFGMRAGGPIEGGDAPLENELSRRGVDAYHTAYPSYFFCAVCDLENGSVVVLSTQLWASEIVRRARPALASLKVEVRVAA